MFEEHAPYIATSSPEDIIFNIIVPGFKKFGIEICVCGLSRHGFRPNYNSVTEKIDDLIRHDRNQAKTQLNGAIIFVEVNGAPETFAVISAHDGFTTSVTTESNIHKSLEQCIANVLQHYLVQKVSLFDNFKKGVIFKDLSVIMAHPKAFQGLVHLSAYKLKEQIKDFKNIKFIGLDARGFIFGGALAAIMGCGFVMARKKGKLPVNKGQVNPSAKYATEYSEDEVEIMNGIIKPGDKVIPIDDLIATGGTFIGVTQILNELKAEIVAYCVIMKVDALFEIAQKKLSKPVIVIL